MFGKVAAILLFGITTSAFASIRADFNCYNKNEIGPMPMELKLRARSAKAIFQDKACSLKRIAYNPRSSKYQGWIRVGSGKGNCEELGEAMFGGGGSSTSGIGFYWISISREVQNGEEGFIQIGSQNIWDPGSGAVAKSFLRCFPE